MRHWPGVKTWCQITGADASGNSIPVGSGTAAQLVNHVPDRIDHKLRLLGLYVVARVCVEDKPGIQALCQRFLPRDVGFEDDGAEVHRDARWQAALGGEGLQIVGLIRGKDDDRHRSLLNTLSAQSSREILREQISAFQ